MNLAAKEKQCHHWLGATCLVLHVLLLTRHRVAANKLSSSSGGMIAPINNWEPSWVASAAQGTSVAVSCQLDSKSQSDDCVLLLMRSTVPATVTSSLQWKPTRQREACKEMQFTMPDETTNSVKFWEIPTEEFSLQSKSPSWLTIGRNTLCSFTGFAPDIDHVSRVLQQEFHVHRYVFDLQASPSLPVTNLVNALAYSVSNAANYGRPFGLQAVLIGTTMNKEARGRPLWVYTVDPSGAWRHWGSGCTAIGRNAETIRENICECFKEIDPSIPIHPPMALELALKSMLKGTKAALVNQDSDQYEAILVWVEKTGRCRMASIDVHDIRDCRDKLWKEMEGT